MSRRSSRSSTMDQGEFILECKAAYLSMFDSIKEKIESQDSLLEALQQTGRNPSVKVLKKYWTNDTDELSFDDFVDICRKEPVTTSDDLMKAFRKIDINGDGYISLEELHKILTSKGEKKSKSEVKTMIDEVDENRDGRLDYKEEPVLRYSEFCKMVMSTTEESKKMQRKMMERKEKKKKQEIERRGDVSGSQVSVRSTASSVKNQEKSASQANIESGNRIGTPSGSRKSSLLSIDDLPRPSPRVKKDKSRQSSVSRSHKLDEPKNLREWTHTKSKGSFFMEDGSLICHQYDFNLPDDSKIWITMQPQKASRGMDSNPVDTSVFILRDRPDEDGNLLVAFTEHRDGRGKYGVSCDLSAGKYYIMPYTTGCRFKSRKSESEKEAKLVSQDKGGKYVITKAFRKVLEDIFDYSDLDGNGFMSRKEFNLFNIRTSGEEVADEEWQVVEDRIDLEDGEITKAGFLQLNELEAEDSEGDTEDLWTTLVSMGYNKQLIMDQACPFQLDVYTEDCDDAELDVVRVDSYPTYPGDLSFDDIISKSFIKHGEISRVKGMKDLCMYTYKNDGWASLVLDNKSHTRVRVELDCSRSENVISNHDSLQRTLRVDPGSTLIAYHLMPEDEDRDWQVKCTETIR
ncbi:EF-hand calcium-binding domain-containing protein 7-like isoform X11 [Mytilus californianus]|uniref:EF-hand calcium-binding domain-containing protein 7-like isoform X11 n=1 Tax=Mytilus californianus TaxID=6549 RepID=UPI00224575E0|nr:EF-hand calcium-binding domain-containing protein 7-like isoform X11 [Mytilus californianus]